MYDQDLVRRMAEYRHKIANSTLTTEEMREVVKLMRSGRVAAASAASSTKRSSTKPATKSGDDLLAELDSL